MAWFVPKNNYFECDSIMKQHMTGTAIGTKFVSPHTSVFMDKMETEFFKNEHLKLWV